MMIHNPNSVHGFGHGHVFTAKQDQSHSEGGLVVFSRFVIHAAFLKHQPVPNSMSGQSLSGSYRREYAWMALLSASVQIMMIEMRMGMRMSNKRLAAAFVPYDFLFLIPQQSNPVNIKSVQALTLTQISLKTQWRRIESWGCVTN